MVALNDLTNSRLCPLVAHLPSAPKPDHYYVSVDDGASYTPAAHWCFIGQVISIRSTFLRLEDRTGESIDAEIRIPDLPPPGTQIGDSLIIFYAELEALSTGQQGLCLRDSRAVKLVQLPIQAIFSIFNNLKLGVETCDNCEKMAPPQASLQRCGRCYIAHYCGRPCQLEHWNSAHRSQCNSFKELRTLLKMDFNSFKDFYVFDRDSR